jgi:hypothetical protein
MQSFSVSVLTREYLSEPVTATDPAVDLTTLPAWMATTISGHNPQNADWKVANWHTDAGVTAVRALLGDTLPLVPGLMTAWLKIDLGDEQPVRAFATLQVS